MDKFNKGDTVDVRPTQNDLFEHEWTGKVIGYRMGYVVVIDQDGNAFDCSEEQLVIWDNTADIRCGEEPLVGT